MGEELVRILTVPPEEKGGRLDSFCAGRLPGLSRARIQKLNREGRIKVDGCNRNDHYRLKGGERIEVRLEPKRQEEMPSPTRIPIRVVYEDDALVVVDKEAGLVVHPAHGHKHDTLVNALLARGIELAGHPSPLRPGIVHRLDKDTSGLMVVAKTEAACLELARQVAERRMQRSYHAIVWGNLGCSHLVVEASIGRHPVHRKKMAVMKGGGKPARTELFVMDSFAHFDYIRAVIHTGRTHQIRVHLAHLSHPVLGDCTYGGRRRKGVGSDARARRIVDELLGKMGRQALHASLLSFSHPVSGKRMVFRSGLPEDMRSALEILYWKDRFQGGWI